MAAEALEPPSGAGDHRREFERLWRGFMTARATLGLVLLVLQAGIYLLNATSPGIPLMICLAYAVATLTLRLTDRPRQLGQTLDAFWLGTVGVDVLTFSVLQLVQGGSINYTALLALPVLMVSILGTPLQAIASAAGVTLLLFAHAGWMSLQGGTDFTGHMLQAALTGAGCFAISFIASQMAARLASVELRAQRSQLAAAVQQQVNQLVIESLTDGILVVTPAGEVALANPAALAMLEISDYRNTVLSTQPGWMELLSLVNASFSTQRPHQARVDIRHDARPVRSLMVRTQLARSQGDDAQGLCVVFMQDQRELEARIRSEKLAGMGRMSAAVAHEIRNPLAAIAQANALLSEDLADPAQQRLSQMISQNASRLDNIIQDVLRLVHVPGQAQAGQTIELAANLQRMCRDWSGQNHCLDEVLIEPIDPEVRVQFDLEHLRRVMTNLLDNALRYASREVGSIQISVQTGGAQLQPDLARLTVWSDGPLLDASVEQHLFEPFFSSESRSSGLGLYICRELCESHGAVIGYARSHRRIKDQAVPGNEFFVILRKTPHPEIEQVTSSKQ